MFHLNSAESNDVILRLFDLSGKMVFNTQIHTSGQQTIEVNASAIGLKPGTYLYQILTGEEIKSGKLIYKP